MANIIPNIFYYDQAKKLIDFENDDMKVALLNKTYNECTLRNAISYDDFIADEVPALYGYPQGGFPIGGKTVTIDSDKNEVVYDINDFGMIVSGGTFGPVRYAMVYNQSNNNHLVYIFDLEEDKTVNDGAEFKIKINDNGLMTAKQLV